MAEPGERARGTRKPPTIRRWLVCAVGAVVGLLAFAQPALAARTVNSVLLSYSTQTNATSVTVPPGAIIDATVNVTHTGTGQTRRWFSTSWSIGGGAPVCVDHTQFSATGTDSVTFNITAPATAGTYNADFVAWQAAGCGTSGSATFTLAKAVVVSTTFDNSTVTANPASVAADGFSTSTITVTIRDGASNPVAGKTVTLAALSGSSSISAPSGPSNASGVVTFSVWNSTVQSVTYRATNVTDKFTLGQTATVGFTALPKLSFNAVEPGANAFSGRIFTKIAGAAFTLDIVARSGAAVLTTFNSTVRVEIVDSSSGGACAALPVIAAFPNLTFAPADKGRRSLAGTMAPNVYRDARVRMGSPAAAPTVISCSSDNFAIRPAVLTWTVTDGTRATPGTVNVLNNTAIPGGRVHNAGRPFTITATAYNGAAPAAITSNYNGAPTAALSACAGAACTPTPGTLALGAWAAAGGTVTTNSATYDDLGAFRAQLLDDTYAAVDASDGTPAAQRTISSATADVGRFVPDRFVVSATSITQRSDIPGCGASTFTYMGESMNAAFTLTAVRFPAGTLSRYTGAFAQLDLTDPASFRFGAIDSAGPTPLTPRLDTVLGTPGTWTNGVATDVLARLSVRRLALPDGPYASVRFGIAPVDVDGVTLDPAALDLDADNSGSSERALIGAASVLRFGRLRLQNGHGSQLIAMPLPMHAQYWNGTAFVTNTADSCTTIGPANIALGNYRRNLAAGETTVSTGGALNAGVGTVRLSAPGPANDGSVDVSVNLTGAPAGASCTAGMPASTPSGFAYLQGAWCGAAYDRDPTARATFGVYRSGDRVIFQRENY